MSPKTIPRVRTPVVDVRQLIERYFRLHCHDGHVVDADRIARRLERKVPRELCGSRVREVLRLVVIEIGIRHRLVTRW